MSECEMFVAEYTNAACAFQACLVKWVDEMGREPSRSETAMIFVEFDGGISA